MSKYLEEPETEQCPTCSGEGGEYPSIAYKCSEQPSNCCGGCNSTQWEECGECSGTGLIKIES